MSVGTNICSSNEMYLKESTGSMMLLPMVTDGQIDKIMLGLVSHLPTGLSTAYSTESHFNMQDKFYFLNENEEMSFESAFLKSFKILD